MTRRRLPWYAPVPSVVSPGLTDARIREICARMDAEERQRGVEAITGNRLCELAIAGNHGARFVVFTHGEQQARADREKGAQP